MPGIIGRKGQVNPVATVAPYHRRLFTIAKARDMNIPVSGLFGEKLANYGRYRSKGDDNYDMKEIFPEFFH